MPVHPDAWQRFRSQQRSHWPDGHIRLGDSVPHGNGIRPLQLTTFRFSSPSKTMIEAAAARYGGQVIPMTRGRDKWQVITGVDEIQVIIPQGAVSQWMEYWENGYCFRRCDGATVELRSRQPCLCKAERSQLCSIYTRLNLFLADLPSLGLWLLVSKGVIAADNLPARAALAERAGPYVEATLETVQGRGLDSAGKPTTFRVPHLRIEGIEPRTALTQANSQANSAELAAPQQTAALQAAPPQHAAAPDYLADLAACRTADEVAALWRTAERAGHLSSELRIVLNRVGTGLRQSERATAATDSAAPADGPSSEPTGPSPAAPAHGELPADRLRTDIFTNWPSTTSELHEAFLAATGTTLRRATPVQLQDFLTTLLQAQTATDHLVEVGDPPGNDEVVDAEMVDDDPPDP